MSAIHYARNIDMLSWFMFTLAKVYDIIEKKNIYYNTCVCVCVCVFRRYVHMCSYVYAFVCVQDALN